MADGEREPLLPAVVVAADGANTFCCWKCMRICRSRTARDPVFLLCPHCGNRFVASVWRARRWLVAYILLGFAFIGLGIGLTIASYEAVENSGGGTYFVFYGLAVAGGVLLLRAFFFYIQMRKSIVANASTSRFNDYVRAAKDGNITALQLAIRGGFNVNTMGGATEDSLLSAACQAGQVAVVRFLLSAGADPNQRTKTSCPFIIAASHGHLDIMRILIEAGADDRAVSEAPGSRGQPVQGNALLFATTRGHVDVVQFLLQRRHDPNIQLQGSDPPLLVAARGGYVEIIALLHGAGADMNIQNPRGLTALHVAVLFKQPDAAHALLRHGCSLDRASFDGITPEALATQRHVTTVAAVFRDWREHADPLPAYEEVAGVAPPGYAS